MTTAVSQSHPNRPRLVAFALALITLLVYLPVCFHDWIFFDDPTYVLDNNIVQKGITWAGIKWAFIGWHASNWHPLTWLLHMLDCELFGLNPGPQHFVNVLFHAANSALLFVLWHRLTRALWPSALVAALFAWHPLHVESVAWIAERKDVLSAFFGLLALLAYVGYVTESQVQPVRPKHSEGGSSKSKVFYGLAILFFALGLLAKPMLVTLPFVMLLLDFWPLGRIRASASPVAKSETQVTEHGARSTGPFALAFEKTPFFLLTLASCVVTFLAQRQQAVLSLKQYSLTLRLENALVSYAIYLFKFFCPVHLAAYYPLPDEIPVLKLIGATAILAIISIIAWRCRKKNPGILVGWLWFLGTLVPVIGLVQVGGQAMADRYMYLPSIGVFVAVIFGIAEASAQLKFQKALAPAAALVLVASIAVTEYQLHFWRNTQTLFTHALDVTENNGPAHMMLGVWLESQGRQTEALREYQDALRCDDSLMVVAGGEKRPLAAQLQLLLGQSAEQKKMPSEAIAHYQDALRSDPALVEAYNNLANLLDDLGKPIEALSNYQSAVRLEPLSPLVHENLGTELTKLGRFDEAAHEYQDASRLVAPDDPRPFYLMGKALLRHGQTAQAVTQFETALQRDTNDIQSLTYLARVLASDENPKVRDGSRAVTLAEKANALTGGNQPFVLGSLAMAYAEAGHFDDARQAASNALQHAPPATELSSNLQAQLRAYESNSPWRESVAP